MVSPIPANIPLIASPVSVGRLGRSTVVERFSYFALFFSLGLLGGGGGAPAPALAWRGACSCSLLVGQPSGKICDAAMYLWYHVSEWVY